MTTKTKPRVTIDSINEHLERVEDRKALQREVDAMKRAESITIFRLIEHVEAKGGKNRQVTLGPHTLKIVELKKAVSWKNEFIATAGEIRAAELVDEQPTRDVLEIT